MSNDNWAAWVPVGERLPEFPDERFKDSVTCIVTTAERAVMALQWTRHTFAKTERGRAPRWEWRGTISPWAVTHWMPLPPPPEPAK